MQTLSIEDSDRTTTADSFPTLFATHTPMWFSNKQPVSKSVETTKDRSFYHLKLSEPQCQDQDSSSTLSTDQSHHEGSTSSGSDVQMPSQLVATSCGNVEYFRHQVQMEHNQSLDWAATPYFGRIATAYDPNSVIYPHMMGERAVLPLDRDQGVPMLVNVKQYNAILRRRQTRAKLMAQNKVARTRKPYLHESRHHHALRRARGSGGRFLNTKKSGPTAQESKIQHPWGTSTAPGSDGSCIFNKDEFFQQPRMGTKLHMMALRDMLL